MKALNHFSIPLKGIGNGSHHFTFYVDDSFFEHFENDLIKKGNFEVELEIERNSGVNTLIFKIAGSYQTLCDRCTAEIILPIDKEYTLLLKLGEESESTDEVWFIHPDTSILSMAEIIYEYIILSIPMIKVYDCEKEDPRPCDLEILEKIKSEEIKTPANSIWDQLNELDLNNN